MRKFGFAYQKQEQKCFSNVNPIAFKIQSNYQSMNLSRFDVSHFSIALGK